MRDVTRHYTLISLREGELGIIAEERRKRKNDTLTPFKLLLLFSFLVLR